MTTQTMTMTKDTKIWDRFAEGYAKKPVADEDAYQAKLAKTRSYFTPDMELLEFGCGTGSTAIVHAPHVKHIRAVDISPKMIEIARRKTAAEQIDNITYDVSTVEALSVPDNSVDMVLALSLLHLLEDKDAAIAKIYKMLKPGGLFVTSTICLGDSMKWFKLIGPIGYALGIIPRVQTFKKQELMDSFVEAGFAIDHHWTPGKGKALFAVAKKAA